MWQVQYGFDHEWWILKCEIIEILSHGNKQLALNMQFMDCCNEMSPEDPVSYFITNENQTINMVCAMKTSILAWKYKKVCEHEEDEEGDDNQEEMT